MIDIKSIQLELDAIFNADNYSVPKVKEIAGRGYAVCVPEKAKVLLLGHNPSFLDGDRNKSSFTFTIEKAIQDYPAYYGNVETLASSICSHENWAYLDTFVYRETNQKGITGILASSEGLEFLVKQLVVTQKMIEEIQPELIIVCSGGARVFYGVDRRETSPGVFEKVWMGYNFDFSEEFGVHIINGLHPQSILGHTKSTNLKGVPVLFTSNLKYMDKSNKERLVWQAKRILANRR